MLAELKAHRKLFDILNRQPIISPAAIAMIDAWEKRHGRILPAAVKEWYSLEGIESILNRQSERKTMTLVEFLANVQPLPRSNIWIVEKWLVDKIDYGSVDVLLDDRPDPQLRYSESWYEFGSFTTHILELIWDDSFKPPRIVLATPPNEAKIGPRELDFLSVNYREYSREGPRTFMDPRTAKPLPGWSLRLKLYDSDIRLVITALSGNPRNEQVESNWRLSCDTDEAVERFVKAMTEKVGSPCFRLEPVTAR